LQTPKKVNALEIFQTITVGENGEEMLSPTVLKPLVIDSSSRIFVSKKITNVIQQCINSQVSEIEPSITELWEDYDSQKNDPFVEIDYNKTPKIDAYTIKYLPRNTLVPKLGLLCCAYHSSVIPDKKRLNILDLGSGTGAIPLGLLDLFQNIDSSDTKCDIYAVDISYNSLLKQQKLISEFGLDGSTHSYDIADFSNPSSYRRKINVKGPFDIIFSANLLSELKPNKRSNILAIIRDNLKEDGICIIAESQISPAKTACAFLSHEVDKYGLSIFYPCPPDSICNNEDCWKWFEYKFTCDDVYVEQKKINVTKSHKLIWRIIVKRPLSIYDYLNKKKKHLNWGITRPRGKRNEFCTNKGQFDATIKSPLPINSKQKWSQIIGMTDDRIQASWNPFSDVTNCNCETEKF